MNGERACEVAWCDKEGVNVDKMPRGITFSVSGVRISLAISTSVGMRLSICVGIRINISIGTACASIVVVPKLLKLRLHVFSHESFLPAVIANLGVRV